MICFNLRNSFCWVLLFLLATASYAGAQESATGPSGQPAAALRPPGLYPLAGVTFYVNPRSVASSHVHESCSAYFPDSPPTAVAKIAARAQAVWYGDWNSVTELQQNVKSVVHDADIKNQVPILVVYDMVHRDCGEYSKGGAADASAYRDWITKFAQGLGAVKVVVVLEPDALSQLKLPKCLSRSQQLERLDLVAYDVFTIKAKDPNALIYIDAGHEGAISPPEMAERLRAANIAQAQGFALNVANYISTEANRDYGDKVSALVGGKHFVVDTGRNGRGGTPDRQWCNPKGQGLGMPSIGHGSGLMDAGLMLLNPGGSDGDCDGNPPAGRFSLQLACSLVKNYPVQ